MSSSTTQDTPGVTTQTSYDGNGVEHVVQTYDVSVGQAPLDIEPTNMGLPSGSYVVNFNIADLDPSNENYIGAPNDVFDDQYKLSMQIGQGTASLIATSLATGAAETLATVHDVATVLVNGQWQPVTPSPTTTNLITDGLDIDTGPKILTDQSGGTTASQTLALSGNAVSYLPSEYFNFAQGEVVNIADNGVQVGSATIQSVNAPGTQYYIGPNDTSWAATINLTPGDNAITITTTDANGLTGSAALDYTYNAPAASGTGSVSGSSATSTPSAGSGTAPGGSSGATTTAASVGLTPSGSSATNTPSTGSSTASGGSSGTTAAAVPNTPAPVDSITLDPGVTYLGRGTFELTGHATSTAGVGSVELTADVDGAATDLGSATVAADGSFVFTDHVGRHTQGSIAATLTDGAGATAVAAGSFDLAAGLTGGAFVARQDSYDPATGNVADVSLFRADGSRAVQVGEAGQTLTSTGFDSFHNAGQPDTTFVFTPGYGFDVVHGLHLGGGDHDTLSLPASDFTSIADVLAHAHQGAAGTTIFDPVAGDMLRLAGVTKAQLAQHSGDLALHA